MGDACAASLNRGRASINTQSLLEGSKRAVGSPALPFMPERGARVSWPSEGGVGRAISKLVERERVSGNGPAAFAFAMALGAAQYAAAPREIAWIAIVGLLLPCVAGLTVVRTAPLLRGGLWLLLGLALGLAAAKGQVARTQTVMMVGEATTRVSARVFSSTIDARGRVRYDVDVVSTAQPTLQFAPSRARIFVSARHERLGVGDRFGAVVRLRQPSGPAVPGGYDFAFHNFFDGIGAQGFMLGRPELLAKGRPAGLIEHVATLREGIATIVRSSLSGGSGGVAAALLTGDRRGIADDTTEALRASGLAHVLAISGLHMALVSGLVLASARTGLSGFADLASRRAVRKTAAIIALVFATAYLLLSGASVSATRAYVMLALMLAAVLYDRPALTMRNVGIAAIIVILIEPHAVVGPGCQMSFGATAALVATYTWWRHVRSWSGERDRWLPPIIAGPARFMVGLAVTSLVAGVATGLFAAYHFHRVAPYGFVANLLAMPIVSLAVMPLVVLTALAMPFGLEGAILPMLGATIDWVVHIAERVSSWQAPLGTGSMATWRFALATLSLAVLVLCRTRLRALAMLPIAVVGLTPAQTGSGYLLVADRGSQTAIVRDGVLHLGGTRSNTFVTDQWADAFVSKPVHAGKSGSSWICRPDLCTARVEGTTVAFTETYEALDSACRDADIVVTPRRIRRNACPDGSPIIGGRLTGARGAIIVPLASLPGSRASNGEGALAAMTYALPHDARPWTEHRHKTLKRSTRTSSRSEPAPN